MMGADTVFEGDGLRHLEAKLLQPRPGQYLEAVERLHRLIRERHGCGVAELAVRWILDETMPDPVAPGFMAPSTGTG